MAVRWTRLTGLAVAVALLAATACGDDSGDGDEDGAVESTTTTTASEVVALGATADGACTVSGGPVATGILEVSVTNDSDEPLFVGLLLIDEGRTLEDVQAALDARPESDVSLPEFTTLSASTEETPPGGTATESVALTETGEYAVGCLTAVPPTEPGVLAPDPLVVE